VAVRTAATDISGVVRIVIRHKAHTPALSNLMGNKAHPMKRYASIRTTAQAASIAIGSNYE